MKPQINKIETQESDACILQGPNVRLKYKAYYIFLFCLHY